MFMKNGKVTKTQKIYIPKRADAPETNLHLKIMQTDERPLGSRPIIFVLPGGPGLDHSTFQSYTCLLDTADLVFHDPRGCGKSDKNDPRSYSMENYIEDIEAIRQALQLNKIILAGKSYGSVCAMGYALRYQHALDKLILSAGAPSFRSLETAKENLKKIANETQLKAFDKLFNGELKSAGDLTEFYIKTAPLYSPRLKTKLETYLFAMFTKNFSYEAANLGYSSFLRTFDFEPHLHKIKCDTLIIAGDQDWVNDLRHIQVMADNIPNNTLKIFENAGHAIEVDVGKPYFDTIRQFLKGEEISLAYNEDHPKEPKTA